ncbi:unnamed protein product [Vitrella brassicaformis CCMP3155]|uniref:Uncharacterized protein n=1 Tax=Vitrella brassicaformis (strain CCMP3155) TaxID=1169540 RepID=A0A0G4H6X1_VITBC|nr:unnamed protein product [Vitrella brassicaformis CCMP3155]|eukprot:CEM39617.1 unnamed protein product [Vitrella brassicaformis CCMP3155]
MSTDYLCGGIGWMSEESFFKQQRMTQQAILAEIKSYQRRTRVVFNVMKVGPFGTDRVYCVVSLFSNSEEGHEERHPPPDTGAIVSKDGVLYPSYQLVPLTIHHDEWTDQRLPHDGCGVRITAIVSKIISTLLRTRAHLSGRLWVDHNIRGEIDLLFWRKFLCRAPHPLLGSLTFYFIPAPLHVVTNTLEAAAVQSFGDDQGEELRVVINEFLTRSNQMRRLHTVESHRDMLNRDEGRKEIEWEVKVIGGAEGMIDRMCREAASQMGVRRRQLSGAVAQLKADFIESAVAITDAFRHNLIEYTRGMEHTNPWELSLGKLAKMTEQEMLRVEEEVAATEYPEHAKRMMAVMPSPYSEERDGPMVTLADGREVCDVDMLLSTQGLI